MQSSSSPTHDLPSPRSGSTSREGEPDTEPIAGGVGISARNLAELETLGYRHLAALEPGGALHVAEHAEHGIVAVKLGRRSDSKREQRRFEREARMLGERRHPNVVAVLDAATLHEGRPFVVMEYLAGVDLREALRHLDEPRTLVLQRWALDMARGLAAIHDWGILHRDIKPSNLFLSMEDGRTTLKLIDFGLAKPLHREWGEDSITERGFACGTPMYMSPEQVRAGPLTAQSDVYSAGVVLYQIASGRPPFVGPRLEVMSKHLLHCARPVPREIPEPWRRLIRRCLAKEPGERYADGAALLAAVEAAASKASQGANSGAE